MELAEEVRGSRFLSVQAHCRLHRGRAGRKRWKRAGRDAAQWLQAAGTLFLTGARITAESSPLNTMPLLQTVFQVIMGDILMEGAKMGPPFEITVQDAPGMAADFTAPPPVAGQPDVAGRVLMIVDDSHIFMMMGLGPMEEWDASGSAQFQRILETVRFLN
ncbi:MAG: hypothetical protein R2911_18575 [Caldilineaceae bacterium]